MRVARILRLAMCLVKIALHALAFICLVIGSEVGTAFRGKTVTSSNSVPLIGVVCIRHSVCAAGCAW